MNRLDSGKILAIDDRHMVPDQRVRTVVQPFEKEADNPVEERFSDWEIPGSVPGLVISDPVSGEYRMFFSTYHHEMGAYPTGTATSTDGLSWCKDPHFLDDREFIGLDRGYQGMSVCFHPEAATGDYRFFASVIFREAPAKGLPFRVHFKRSRDGQFWEWLERDRYWDGCSDVINVLWDRQRQRFVSYHKLWRVTGVDENEDQFREYFTSFDAKATGEGKVRVTGNRLFGEAADSLVDKVLVLGEQADDDGGGGFTTDRFRMIRVVARAESEDFVHWERNAVILEPLADAEPDEQSYGMPVFEYAGIYLGLPRHFRGRSGKLCVRTAWSLDGVSFTAPEVDAIDCGAPGTWDGGMVLAAAEPVVLGDRLCVYYGGYDQDHTRADGSVRMRWGRAWLRLDGFASRTGGLLRAKPLRSSARSLRVNGRGRIGITIRSAAGNLLHTADWHGDSTDTPVVRAQGPLSDEAFTVEFDLTTGELFAFLLE